MEIIKMNDSHVAGIVEMEKLCFSDPWSENSIRYELTNPLSLWLVAVEDGQVVGYVGSQTVLGEADMMNLAVREEYRRRGIAEMLVNGLVAQLKAQGSRILLLEVRASNDPAIALYEKLGFVQVGRRPNYYHKPKEDALILRKEWSV